MRAEYSHLPVEDYVRARVRILHKLLARPSLFVSPLAQPWEEPARQNVSAELQRLEKELAKLEAAEAAAADAERGAAPGPAGPGGGAGHVPTDDGRASAPRA